MLRRRYRSASESISVPESESTMIGQLAGSRRPFEALTMGAAAAAWPGRYQVTVCRTS